MLLSILIYIVILGLIIVWIFRLKSGSKSEPKNILGPCSVCGKYFTNKEGGYIEDIPYCSEKCFDKAEYKAECEEIDQELKQKETIMNQILDREMDYDERYIDFDIDDKKD